MTPSNSILDIPVEEVIIKVILKQGGDDRSTVGSKRKIHFAPQVEIHYIPCLAEYRDAKILPSMFWTTDDLQSFRTEVLHSLVNYLATVPKGTDTKLALREMITAEAFDGPSMTIAV